MILQLSKIDFPYTGKRVIIEATDIFCSNLVNENDDIKEHVQELCAQTTRLHDILGMLRDERKKNSLPFNFWNNIYQHGAGATRLYPYRMRRQLAGSSVCYCLCSPILLWYGHN